MAVATQSVTDLCRAVRAFDGDLPELIGVIAALCPQLSAHIDQEIPDLAPVALRLDAGVDLDRVEARRERSRVGREASLEDVAEAVGRVGRGDRFQIDLALHLGEVVAHEIADFQRRRETCPAQCHAEGFSLPQKRVPSGKVAANRPCYNEEFVFTA